MLGRHIPPQVCAALGAALALTLAAAAPGQERDATPPRARNIVVLFSDDAGWVDFGFQPDAAADVRDRTPHIDSIAAGGARFSQAYMSGAVCSPSRAGLFTGRYQQRFGHERNIPQGYMRGGLPLEERTFADRLRTLGMHTGLVGKWHLGYPEAHHPDRRGFDWFHGLLQGSRSYLPLDAPSAHQVIQENGEPLPETGHVTDRFGAAAARYIDEHADEPFVLFVSFTAPHGPLQPKPEDLEGLDTIENPRRRNFVGLQVGLDRAVGRILDAIGRHDLARDTLVIFTNDNGGQTQVGADNGPLRGRKGDVWEGGIRVPMAMRWPGVIEPGTVIDDPVIALDLLPTFVSAVGGTTEPAWKLDGVDLLPRLRGELDRLPDRTLFWRTDGFAGPVAARRGPHKLVIGRGADEDDAHLFDLTIDREERRDISAERPETVRELRAAIAGWEAELIGPLWGGGARGR